jgi:hypothetical protein
MVNREFAKPSDAGEPSPVPTNPALATDHQVGAKEMANFRPSTTPGQIPNREQLLADLGGKTSPPSASDAKVDPAACRQEGTLRVFKSYVGTSDIDMPVASAVKVSPDGGTAPSYNGKSYWGTAYHVGKTPDLYDHYSLMRDDDLDKTLKGDGLTRKGLDDYRRKLDARQDPDSEDAAETERKKSDLDYVRKHFDEIDGSGGGKKDGRITKDELGSYYLSHYQVKLEMPDGTFVQAKRAQGSKANDAAILSSPPTSGEAMPLSVEIKIGDHVEAVGYAHGQNCVVRPGKVTGFGDMVSSDAFTVGGMSGGALVDLDQNKDGRHPVVGFTSGGARDPSKPHSKYVPAKVVLGLFGKELNGETSE